MKKILKNLDYQWTKQIVYNVNNEIINYQIWLKLWNCTHQFRFLGIVP